ncbi:MAG: FtsW/RodA/SpoVE family cell cycle protein [Spirochaetaceae bacterium]|nr:FtsW/RodA/SpoVE family cell cycle protein [Spirochaetaceae bacterium]
MSISKKIINKSIDLSFIYFLCILTLCLWGMVVMYSSSYHEANIHNLPHYYYLQQQFKFFVLAIFVSIIVRFINFKIITIFIYPLIVVSIICMLLTLYSPYGVSILGAKRWLEIGPIPSFQPSEIVKVSTILFIAKYYSKENHPDYIPLIIVLINASLILLQKDYSTTVLYLLTSFLMLLVCGCDFKKLFIIGLFLLIPALYAILAEPFRIKRIVSFLNPSLDPNGINYQINNSLLAIKRGGLFGVGLGNAIYKLGKLPEVQNDFIFSNLVEETGFFGVIVTLAIFYLVFRIGYTMSVKLFSSDKMKSYICFGISSSLSLQLIINVMVVTALLPPTGIPLPFLSQGGTNLFFTIIETSIIYKIIVELQTLERDINKSSGEMKNILIEGEEYSINNISKINIETDFVNYLKDIN